ncbi:adenosine receptor A2b-like isoform X2 [Paramuricea clavata]|uniref:Adenosine receptor A2b-like isoform X2 n=1 Tax=Paramuricea clavata TaxID=317549 RepID=A0A6S7H190_PARCT|nr:adenosine receptor A2b-like isoform X2 [Paramuricea clavata]
MNSSDDIIYITCIHPDKVYHFGPAGSYSLINIPLIVINSLLLLFTILGNFTVILAYFRNTSLQSVPNMLLITLAFTDLFVGVVAQPLFMAALLRDVLSSKPLCWLALLSSVTLKFCGGASFLTLSLIISLERYFAICHPFKHRLWVTKTKVKRAIFILWLFLLALTGSLLLGFNYNVYFVILTLMTFTGIVVLTFACCGILMKLKTRRERHVSVDDIDGRIRSHVSPSTTSNEAEKRDYKIAVTMFYIIGAIVVCYTPMFAAIIYAQVIGNRDKLYLKYFYPIAMTLIFLNSSLNPVIYCLRNRKFISAIRNLCGVSRNEANSSAYTISSSNFLA